MTRHFGLPDKEKVERVVRKDTMKQALAILVTGMWIAFLIWCALVFLR